MPNASSQKTGCSGVEQQSTNRNIEPEWITVAEACAFASVSKPVIYNWMNRGLVKNFSAKERGQVRGVRRVSLDSLRAFLNSRATGGIA